MLRAVTRVAQPIRAATVANIRSLASVGPTSLEDAGSYGQLGSGTHSQISDEPSVTTLDNGVRVASIPSESPVARVAVYINAGSRFENAENAGVTAFLARNAFQATTTRSEYRVVKDFAHLGADTSAIPGRSSLVYTAKTRPEHVRDSLMLIADTINNSRYMKLEVTNSTHQFEEEVKERSFNGNHILEEAIHAAAYSNNTLGLPLYPPLSQLPKLDRYAILSYVDSLFTPNRFVVVGSGIAHEQLVKISKELFTGADLPARRGTADVAAKYTGGDCRVHRRGLPGAAYIALGFNGATVASADFAAQRVLQNLLEGSRLPVGTSGGGVSAGGVAPHLVRQYGSAGSQSRLASVAKGAQYLSTLGSSYVDGGVFAVGVACQPVDAELFAGRLASSIKSLTSSVTSDELTRAKVGAKNALFAASQCKNDELVTLAEQVVAGATKSKTAVAAAIDSVSESDVTRVARQMLSTPLSVAGYGDLSYLPRYDQLLPLFK